MSGKVAARDVRELLRKRFNPGRYSVMEEVGDATGAMQTRRLDMVVVSSWPSDGYAIEGIEIKVSKSDLKHELENPQKHNVFFGDIDFFSLAAPREVITMSLIPGKWGVYEVYEDGKGELKLKCKRKPIALSDEPKRGVSLPFFASIVRRVRATSLSAMRSGEVTRRGVGRPSGDGSCAAPTSRSSARTRSWRPSVPTTSSTADSPTSPSKTGPRSWRPWTGS